MMAITWPAVLRFSDLNFEVEARARTGGISITGAEQVVATGAGRWRADGTVPVNSTPRILAYRALRARLRGRAETVLVPVCDGRSPGRLTGQPFSDFTFFSDATGFADTGDVLTLNTAAALGATVIQIGAANLELTAGQYFSIGTRLYIIAEVTGQAGNVTTVVIAPPLRAAAAAGTTLEFTAPVCEMRLAADDSGELALSLNRFAVPAINFVEAL